MDANLLIQLTATGICIGLIYLTINIKSFVANPYVNKYLGGILILVATIFGGKFPTKKKPETEKPGEPYN